MTETSLNLGSETLPSTIIIPAIVFLVTTMYLGITLGIHRPRLTDMPVATSDTDTDTDTPTPVMPEPDFPPFGDGFWLTVLWGAILNADSINRWVIYIIGIIFSGGPLNFIALNDLRSIVAMLYFFHQVVFEYLSLHADYLEQRDLPFINIANRAVDRWMHAGNNILILLRIIEWKLRIRPENTLIPRQPYEDYW